MGKPTPHRKRQQYEEEQRGEFSVRQCLHDYLRDAFTVYEMPKVVMIQFSWVGILSRLLQISIIGYFIGWVLLREKGYQSFERPIHGVSAKVRGTVFSNIESENSHLAAGPIIYTDADLVQPPVQNSGFFLVTRIYSTVDQLQNYCPESSDLLDARCLKDEQCPFGKIAGTSLPDDFAHHASSSWFDVESNGHGPFTGRCLSQTRTCEVFAWCPVLEDTDARNVTWSPSLQSLYGYNARHSYPDDAFSLFKNTDFLDVRRNISTWSYFQEGENTILYETLLFTVLIRNSIEFPFYKIKRTNVLTWMNDTYLRYCRYNASNRVDRYCPRFRILDIIEGSGANTLNILHNGGIIEIIINWECNLDIALDKCLPIYSFRYLGALDSNEEEGEDTVVHMDEKFYLEFSNYFGSAKHRRLLHKTNGIQFIISVTGKGGKFSLLEFSMKVGSCMALFGTATLLCDLILVHISGDRRRYKRTISRLSTLTKSAAFIARLRMNLPPPKPALNDPDQLSQLIEFYEIKANKLILPGIRINLANEEGGIYKAKITEEDRHCPSLITRQFKSVSVALPTVVNQSRGESPVYNCAHPPSISARVPPPVVMEYSMSESFTQAEAPHKPLGKRHVSFHFRK